MKRFDYRILVGAALILGGILMLLDQTGILQGATGYFWAGLLAIAAAVFLFWFFSDKTKWWAAIPGFTLLGMAASILLPGALPWGGLTFLGGIGVGFWAVYLRQPSQWWAIIPGGVLLTLGVVSVLADVIKDTDTAGLFFVGLGITFLLVGLLAKMKWAYIPAAVLLLMGFLLSFLLGTPFEGVLGYIWIGVILVAGIILVISAARPK